MLDNKRYTNLKSLSSVFCYFVFLLLAFAATTGCGGNSATAGNNGPTSSPPPSPAPQPPASPGAAEIVYVAETTGNNSGTLQAFTVDSSGGLTSVGSPINTAGSSSLAATPTGKFLYVGGGQSVRIFSVAASNGALTEVNGGPQVADGNTVFRLVMDPFGHFLYVSTSNAASETNNLLIFPVNSSTGALGQSLFMPGVDIDAIDAQDKFAYSYGIKNGPTSFVDSFAVDRNTGALTAAGNLDTGCCNNFSSVLPHPSGNFLYAISSEAPGVQIFSVSSTGQLASMGSVESTCGGADFGGLGLMHPSGKFLYHFTRQPGVIVHYAVDGTTGALSDQSCFSIPPGTFNPVDNLVTGTIDPTGRFVFGASFNFQTNASTLHTFSVDPGTGALTLLTNVNVPLGSGSFSGTMLALRTGQQ